MRAVLMAMLMMVAGFAQAASLQVSPVRVELPSNEVSRPLWVSNSGKETISVQVRVFKWTQANGKDVLTPTTEVVATPALTSVEPGGRQLVRMVRKGPGPATEQAYRLRVEELPGARKAEQKPALNLLLAYSIPMFLVGQDPVPASPLTGLTVRVEGNELVMRNDATRQVMISDLKALDIAGKETVVRPGLVGYVLSGQTMRFPFEAPKGTVDVQAVVNQTNVARWSASP